MNPSDTPSQTDRITAEIIRAKAQQRLLYILVIVVVLLGGIFTVGVIGFSNGTVIEVRPQEAQKTVVVHVVGGLGMAVGNTAYALTGNPTVEVSAFGYTPLRKTLLEAETGGTVVVELTEMPQLLRVGTTPQSDKTRWRIDGQMVAIAPALEQTLLSGEHIVEIDSPYYQKTSIPVVMELGKPLETAVELTPIAGRLDIQTVPAGASVHIDGQLVGSSPVAINKPGGAYVISVTLGDFKDVSETVEVTNAEPLMERDYRLVVKDAYLQVAVSPVGGKLLLNGKTVDPSGRLTVKARVDNTLTYLKEGYFSQSRTLSVAPGVVEAVSFNLKPEIGAVNIRSKPSASVYVDGKAVGQTPLEINLPATPHRIELRKAGYRTYTQTVTPSAKSPQKISPVLLTELGARLSQAPADYKNSVGMAMKLFKPNDTFVMGAPRHEKGQRANEFLRKVKLVKPFYAAQHEVTGGQYAKFKANRSAANEPATSMSWMDAAAFCNWLSGQENLTPFYDIRAGRLRGINLAGGGYRLLSEAEWEWLARKADKPKQTKFTWGDATTIPPMAGNIADENANGQAAHYVPNYSDGFGGVAPVGSFPPGESGLYDLTGNVSEWVHDVYSLVPPDAGKTETDPLGERVGDTHTVKGSNWRSGTITELRAAYREGVDGGRDDIGFRVGRYVYGGANAQN